MTNKTANVSIAVDGVKVDIALDKLIETEVNKRLEEERQKVRKEFPVINTWKRRNGNTYRTLLYAQLLASSEPEQSVFVVTRTDSYAKDLLRKISDMANIAFCPIGETKIEARYFQLVNGSRIHCISSNRFKDSSYLIGRKNVTLLFDESYYI